MTNAIREKAKRAGEIESELQNIHSMWRSIIDARSLTFTWDNADGNTQKMLIGEPNCCWVNSQFFLDMHAALMKSFENRILELHRELETLIKSDEANQEQI